MRICVATYAKSNLENNRKSMAVCQNSSLLYLDEEDTVLAIRLAEALQYDEVEIFLEIYDSIPSSRELQRVR